MTVQILHAKITLGMRNGVASHCILIPLLRQCGGLAELSGAVFFGNAHYHSLYLQTHSCVPNGILPLVYFSAVHAILHLLEMTICVFWGFF